jgi:transposase-like protein
MMKKKSHPGRYERKGMSLVELFELFPDDATAEAWFELQRWGKQICCPRCGSVRYSKVKNRRPMPYRCKDCRKHFSVKIGTVMEASNLSYQKWALAIYLIASSLKGVSSMKLHRDLKIRQPSAWHLAQRIRQGFTDGNKRMVGPVEADETYVGGKRRNMPKSRRKELHGRGPVGKVAVAGIKDRATNQVSATVVPATDSAILQGFVRDQVEAGAKVYTDDALAYDGLVDFGHESVKHSVAEYVRGNVHTNGIESFWSMFKRGHKGVYHKMSPKHLHRYVTEFVGRHNMRDFHTLQQMSLIVHGMDQKRLRYRDLVN